MPEALGIGWQNRSKIVNNELIIMFVLHSAFLASKMVYVVDSTVPLNKYRARGNHKNEEEEDMSSVITYFEM